MDSYFYHYFKPVSAVHIATVIALLFTSSIRSCKTQKQEVYIPVQFMIEESPEIQGKQQVSQQELPPPVPPKVESSHTSVSRSVTPTAQPSRQIRNQLRGQPKQPSATRQKIQQPQQQRSRPKTLSAAEIEKMLKTALTSERASFVLDDEARCLELIRRTLYEAWIQPSKEESYGTEAIIGLIFDTTGRITKWRFIKKSGNTIFDETVTKAISSVSIIPGLSPSFLAEQREITVLFKIGEGE